MERETILIIDCSERHSDLYYATRFLAPDDFIFLQIDGRKLLVMSDLEIDRAKSQARVDQVLSYSEIEQRLKSQGAARPTSIDVVDAILNDHGVKRLTVPGDFKLRLADVLRARGYELVTKPDPFFPERLIKSEDEVAAIAETQRATELAVGAAIELLRAAVIKNGQIVGPDGVITSETIKKVINVKLMELDCVAQHTIIAGGIHGCDPHDEGSGPLAPNESIVMDVFPRSSRTRYYADMTRTVVKGRAPEPLRKMYDLVREAQERAIEEVRDGADGQAIHQRITERFERAGFKTGPKDGRMQGFFHGTGHGVGLDIHEPPRISRAPDTLKVGQVVTVEPGLYYPEIGAVRIEDMVRVTATGCTNFTRFPKFLEV